MDSPPPIPVSPHTRRIRRNRVKQAYLPGIRSSGGETSQSHLDSGASIPILPYSKVVGQERLKQALQLAYVEPSIGGVLVSGQRGTAKSTTVRAFARMAYGQLPVTLPINATDDRVLGGWEIDDLMRGKARHKPGLLEEAGRTKMLYIDEVNLLDDHLVNLILDVVSTGVLTVQREGQDTTTHVSFALVGTMNPEEGGLRPQLLDRFGLMVSVGTETDPERRRRILRTVLEFDRAKEQGAASSFLERGFAADQQIWRRLQRARAEAGTVGVPRRILELSAAIADGFEVAGHRADYVMALAARALVAYQGGKRVTVTALRAVAPLALQHRRPDVTQGAMTGWGQPEAEQLEKFIQGG
jgi:magnesium chelatase subunit I